MGRGRSAPVQWKRLGEEHDLALSRLLRYTQFNQTVPLKVNFEFGKATLEASGQWPGAVKNLRGFYGEQEHALPPLFTHTPFLPRLQPHQTLRRGRGRSREAPRGREVRGPRPCPGLARPGRPQPCSGPAAHRVSLSSSAAQRSARRPGHPIAGAPCTETATAC